MSQHPSDPSTPPSASVPPTSPRAIPGEATATPEEIEKGKVLAIIGYIIWIVALVPLIQKDNRFSLYHAKQVLTHFCFLLPALILCAIPFVNCVAAPLVMIVNITMIIFGIINVVNHRMKPLPVIGQFGEKWFSGIQVKQ